MLHRKLCIGEDNVDPALREATINTQARKKVFKLIRVESCLILPKVSQNVYPYTFLAQKVPLRDTAYF